VKSYVPSELAYSMILLDLKLEPLKKERRRKSKLVLFCKNLHHQAALPTDML